MMIRCFVGSENGEREVSGLVLDPTCLYLFRFQQFQLPVKGKSHLIRWEPALGIVSRRPERVCDHFPRSAVVLVDHACNNCSPWRGCQRCKKPNISRVASNPDDDGLLLFAYTMLFFTTSSVPKFGAWNEKRPQIWRRLYCHRLIVNKLKEEKQNATAKLPSPMQQPHTSNTSALADQSKKSKVMLMLRDEFELTKALRGCRSLSEITRNHIVVDWNVPRDFPPAAAEITFEISAIKSFPVLRGNLFFLLKFLHYYDTIKAFV